MWVAIVRCMFEHLDELRVESCAGEADEEDTTNHVMTPARFWLRVCTSLTNGSYWAPSIFSTHSSRVQPRRICRPHISSIRTHPYSHPSLIVNVVAAHTLVTSLTLTLFLYRQGTRAHVTWQWFMLISHIFLTLLYIHATAVRRQPFPFELAVSITNDKVPWREAAFSVVVAVEVVVDPQVLARLDAVDTSISTVQRQQHGCHVTIDPCLLLLTTGGQVQTQITFDETTTPMRATIILIEHRSIMGILRIYRREDFGFYVKSSTKIETLYNSVPKS